MPIDMDTLQFLIDEAMDAALKDTKEKLDELAMKYKVKITAKPPTIVNVEIVENGEAVWIKE
ncbi:MAG: hypothetical protein FK734_13390 [Asgard group archaeon]|nr:hypothetical protein [Asgard group archaeon]